MRRIGRIRKTAGVGLVLAAVVAGTMTLAPTTESGASTPTSATFAEVPQGQPNYIFPFMSLAFFSVYNISQFQQLMYRPLYWFGNGSTPNLNLSISLAQNPTYANGQQVRGRQPRQLQVVER